MDLSKLTERQVLMWGGGAASLYCVLALSFFVGPVSNIVVGKAHDALLVQGAEWADIAINGRDVSVTGTAPSAEAGQGAVDAVTAKWGVRVVRAKYTIEPSPKVEMLAPSGPPITDAIACKSLMDGLLSDGGIQFETGKADLVSAGLPLLGQIGSALLRCVDFTIRIVEHTDNTGDEQVNIRLSEVRAEAVLRYLTDKGVSADQGNGVGLGAAAPVASNDTDEGRSQNRRIEFRVSQ
jgi:peptidoglycan-binding protein ArfA